MDTSSSTSPTEKIPRSGHGAVQPAYQCTVWWCASPDCRGEHHAYIGHSVPATAARPDPSGYGAGFWFPGVQVSSGWNTIDHLQPCVWLYLGGEQIDAEAKLHVHEAKELVQRLQEAIAELEGRRVRKVEADQ